jgi:Halobacterial output domain 1
MPFEPKNPATSGLSDHRTSAETPLVETIIDQVIAARDCEHHDIPPLYEAIDPDALTALYTRGSPAVHFEYAGYKIEITPEQAVLVNPND